MWGWRSRLNCESAPKWDPFSSPGKHLISERKLDRGGVRIGADRGPAGGGLSLVCVFAPRDHRALSDQNYRKPHHAHFAEQLRHLRICAARYSESATQIEDRQIFEIIGVAGAPSI